MIEDEVRTLLNQRFAARNIDAALKHFEAAIENFAGGDWDGVALKAGKFVEAVTKALMLYCGKTLPANLRHFKAGNELRQLEDVDKQKYEDTVRIVVPKGCLFVYEIVNNRGGRHDPGEVDANEMDAKVIIPVIQWVMAELVRFATVRRDTEGAARLIDGLTSKVHPFFEDIDGRTYVSGDSFSAPDIGLLLLYNAYPKRVARHALIDAIARHGATRGAATMAASRLQSSVDDQEGDWKLRANGRLKAETLIRRNSREQ